MTDPVTTVTRKVSPSLALAAAVAVILITVSAIIALAFTDRSDVSVVSSILMIAAPTITGLLAYAGVKGNRDRIDAASQRVEELHTTTATAVEVAKQLSDGALIVNVKKAVTDALNDVAPKVSNNGG